jgi:8-oxo-dGTP pyrophosphatase MutT (NUDIX family)
VSSHPLIHAHPTLRRLAAHLAGHPGALAATDGDPGRAAVAVLFRVAQGGRLELLMIQRAERDGDPWSGHIALPGGRQSPADNTLQDTATRETREETGIDLARDGVVLGTLDELRPRTPVLPPIIVTPFVAAVRADVDVVPSEEVADAFWVPWSLFNDPAVTRESTVNARGAEWRVPSYVLGRHIVWGMTERILRSLVESVPAS